jgi:hypothetical protein
MVKGLGTIIYLMMLSSKTALVICARCRAKTLKNKVEEAAAAGAVG